MITIKEGIHTNIEAEDYHAAAGVSNSMLKRMDRTPAHFKAAMAEPHETTPAMLLGTLLHAVILEPDKPLPDIAVKPDGMSFATKEGKAWRAEQELAKKLIITAEENRAWVGMGRSIHGNTVARDIVQNSTTELSLFTKNPALADFFGAENPLLKCRIDMVPKTKKYLADIKTCEDAGAEFEKTVFTYGYFQQAAFYLDLWNALNPADQRHHFVFIAVEKSPPYAVRLVGLKESAIKAGRGLYIQRLTIWVECTRSGVWPAYQQKITEIDIPSWAHSLLERGAL
jgi:exodeoxyribonuclease VIII